MIFIIYSMSDFIEIKNLTKSFEIKRKLFSDKNNFFTVVDDVSLKISKGKTLGLVGESGCGKSTLGRCIIRLIDSDSGEVIYDGKDIMKFSKDELKSLRKKFQIIFQDPYSTLNPRMTVGSILKEIIRFHKIAKRKDVEVRCLKLLDMVGLKGNAINKYPHEFSGGQRQRIAIARALALEPEFIVCDEPVSALDVSVQSQILNLLKDLQRELNLTYLFISHNLSVIKHISDDFAVMYLGKIIEYSNCKDLFANPQHPYTITLINSIPKISFDKISKRNISFGDVPDVINKPTGCYFHPRCKDVMEICKREYPAIAGNENAFVYCHLKH